MTKIKAIYNSRELIKSNKSCVIYYYGDFLLPVKSTYRDANALGVDTLNKAVYAKVPVSKITLHSSLGFRFGMRSNIISIFRGKPCGRNGFPLRAKKYF